MEIILEIGIMILVFIFAVIVLSRRKDIKIIGFDLFKGKAAIEFTSIELKEIAEEIHEKEASMRAVQSYRPHEFAAEIIQVGGRGSRLINKIAYSLEEHSYLDPDAFIDVVFNQPADRMWVSCKEDYHIVSCTTPEPIFEDAIFPAKMFGLPIKESIKNSIIVRCQKVNAQPV